MPRRNATTILVSRPNPQQTGDARGGARACWPRRRRSRLTGVTTRTDGRVRCSLKRFDAAGASAGDPAWIQRAGDAASGIAARRAVELTCGFVGVAGMERLKQIQNALIERTNAGRQQSARRGASAWPSTASAQAFDGGGGRWTGCSQRWTLKRRRRRR